MKGQVVAYRRVSTIDQHLDRQAFGHDIDRVFEDKSSGKDMKRPGLQEMISYVREGDEVRVWSVDRLGRNLSDLHQIVDTLTKKGVKITFLSENLSFEPGTTDPFKTLHFQLLAIFAQFERSMTERRRLEGIAAARVAGRYKGAGRKRVPFDIEEAKRLHETGLSVRQIAERLGAAKSTVHKELLRNKLR